MAGIATILVILLLGLVLVLILIPLYFLAVRLINTARDDKEKYAGKDYFYLFVNSIFPFLMLGAEAALKWLGNSKELNSFWIIGTISAAIGLLLGNVKPKELPTTEAHRAFIPGLQTEYVTFHKRDNNIIRWCWVFIFIEFVLWIVASIAVAKNELFDFWVNLMLTILIYGVSLYMSYRKELV